MTERQVELQGAGRWPEGLPRSNTELYEQYGAFVTMLVRRYNKVDRDPRDLLNQIWLRLIEADVLTKYVDAMTTEMPATMTTKQMCEFLGISHPQFRVHVWSATTGYKTESGGRKVHQRFVPEPVKGTKCSIHAEWRTEDVVRLAAEAEEHHYFRKQGPITVAKPKFTKKHFMGYLQRSIHHTFCNYCRTKTRKYREHLGEDLRAARDLTEIGSWEDSLEDMASTTLDETVDVQRILDRVAAVVSPEIQAQITGMLIDGCSPERVIMKLADLDPETKRRIYRALQGKSS